MCSFLRTANVKILRNGKARALSEVDLNRLLTAAPTPQHRALWAVQRWTAARISEALQLRWADTAGGLITYRRANTKTKATRQLPQCERLKTELTRWRLIWAEQQGRPPRGSDHLFPGRHGPVEPMTRQAADHALRRACEGLQLEGVSTHSWRRSLAQQAVRAGAELRTVQAITGHKSLASLGEYLDPSPEQLLAVLEASNNA